MDVTTAVAVYGAVTATVAALVSVQSRLDVVWQRRAKVIDELRPSLTGLRDLLAEAQVQPKAAAALRSVRARADLQVIDDLRGRTADRDLKRRLAAVHAACSVVAATPSGGQKGGTYSVGVAVDAALDAVVRATERLDHIERKAPA